MELEPGKVFEYVGKLYLESQAKIDFLTIELNKTKKDNQDLQNLMQQISKDNESLR